MFEGAQISLMDHNFTIFNSASCDDVMDCVYLTYQNLVDNHPRAKYAIVLLYDYNFNYSCDIVSPLKSDFIVSLYDKNAKNIESPVRCYELGECLATICNNARIYGRDRLSVVSLVNFQ